MTKTKKTNVKVKSYTRKDGTRVRSSQRSIETNTSIEFKRGKDKKKRKQRIKQAIIAAASIGGGARIGGIHGFIRGRGGLGGKNTIAERMAKVSVAGRNASKEKLANLANQIKNTPGIDLETAGKSLNKRGRKMAVKHAAIGAGIGATAYGGYRAIKALRNRKKNK